MRAVPSCALDHLACRFLASHNAVRRGGAVVTAEAQRPQLRKYRLQLGWTQQEIADRLAHLVWMKHRERVAVNADMIAKWERGAKGISPRYRDLFCELFGVTADQLGLKNT